MGANDSKEAAAPAAKVAKASFRSEERSQLSQCFSKISQGSQTVTFEQFQAGMRHSLTESIIERLFKEMAQIGQRLSSSKKPAATEEAMFVCAHHLLTASLDERAAAVVHLRADGDHVSQEQLLQVCCLTLIPIFIIVNSSADSR
uniref:Uncharacterized protein n=1 Tax=Plectus sambesii TaxID=2011161 RepID=A0A914UZ47_9BILA